MPAHYMKLASSVSFDSFMQCSFGFTSTRTSIRLLRIPRRQPVFGFLHSFLRIASKDEYQKKTSKSFSKPNNNEKNLCQSRSPAGGLLRRSLAVINASVLTLRPQVECRKASGSNHIVRSRYCLIMARNTEDCATAGEKQKKNLSTIECYVAPLE